MIAASEYENIHVVDSGSVTIGIGILTQRALELVDQGLEAAEIARILTREAKKIRLVAILDTLEYLKRGGRVSKTVAFAGALLNIKPVISVAEGQIGMLGKARGTKQGSKLMMSQIEAMGADLSRPVMLGFTGVSDEAMKKYLEDSGEFWGAAADAYTMIGSVIGTHAGPGAVAAAFFQK
jgi:DegV family protein with EDD domain